MPAIKNVCTIVALFKDVRNFQDCHRQKINTIIDHLSSSFIVSAKNTTYVLPFQNISRNKAMHLKNGVFWTCSIVKIIHINTSLQYKYLKIFRKKFLCIFTPFCVWLLQFSYFAACTHPLETLAYFYSLEESSFEASIACYELNRAHVDTDIASY